MLQLRPRLFVLRDLVEELQGILEMSEEMTATDWRIDIDPELEIVADRRHLLRALHNLCVNAIQSGAATLMLSAKIDDGLIVIDVTDDGPGLPEKARENLFQAFAGSGRKGGTGLGLVIVREVAVERWGRCSIAAYRSQRHRVPDYYSRRYSAVCGGNGRIIKV